MGGVLFHSIILLAAIIVFFPSLRHNWFALHVAMLLGASFFMDYQRGTPLEIFSDGATLVSIIMHFILINIVTFIVYAVDKRRAIKDGWRIPEKTLHSYSIIGGSLAALLASKILRHKNRKKAFTHMFFLIFIAQIALLPFILYFLLQIIAMALIALTGGPI